MADRSDNVPEEQDGAPAAAAAQGGKRPRLTSRTLALVAAVILPIGLAVYVGILQPEWSRRHEARQIADTARVLRGYRGPVWSVAFSPDGKRVAASSGKQVDFRDIGTGRQILSFEGHDEAVLRIVISPDGQLLASTSLDNTVRLWDTESGRAVAVLEGHDDDVLAVAFSPDGTQLVSSSRDRTARLWDVATGKELRSFKSENGFVVDVAFGPGGQQIATASSFRPFKMGSKTITLDEPGEINLWDTRTGKALLSLKGHSSAIFGVDFSPDGRQLVSAGSDGTAKLWDAATGRELRTFQGHVAAVVAVSLSSTGHHLATASDDGTVRLWDVQTAEEILVLDTRQNSPFCVEFARDGRRLAAGGHSVVTLWDLSPLSQLD